LANLLSQKLALVAGVDCDIEGQHPIQPSAAAPGGWYDRKPRLRDLRTGPRPTSFEMNTPPPAPEGSGRPRQNEFDDGVSPPRLPIFPSPAPGWSEVSRCSWSPVARSAPGGARVLAAALCEPPTLHQHRCAAAVGSFPGGPDTAETSPPRPRPRRPCAVAAVPRLRKARAVPAALCWTASLIMIANHNRNHNTHASPFLRPMTHPMTHRSFALPRARVHVPCTPRAPMVAQHAQLSFTDESAFAALITACEDGDLKTVRSGPWGAGSGGSGGSARGRAGGRVGVRVAGT